MFYAGRWAETKDQLTLLVTRYCGRKVGYFCLPTSVWLNLSSERYLISSNNKSQIENSEIFKNYKSRLEKEVPYYKNNRHGKQCLERIQWKKKHIDYQEPLENSVLIWIDTLLVVLWKKQQQGSTFCPVSLGCLIFKANIYNIVSFCFYSLVIFILNPILR